MHSDDDPIDESRSHLNRSLLNLPDSPEAIVDLANALMAERGFKPERHDSCIAVEGVFSLKEPPQAFDMWEYFPECAQWLEGIFGGQLLSAEVHLDQAHPHCHVLVLLPLANGGPSGSNLIGYKQDSAKRLRAFFDSVASKYGLSMPRPALSPKDKAALSRQVHERIRETDDPVMRSRLYSRVSACINRDPRGFAQDLGIKAQQSPAAAMARLGQSPGHGPRTASAESAGNRRLQAAWDASPARSQPETPATAAPTPMGVASSSSADKAPLDQHPSCVGVASFLSTDHPSSPALIPESTVERDSDRPSAEWDTDLGDFSPQPTPARRDTKAWAQATVAALLADVRTPAPEEATA